MNTVLQESIYIDLSEEQQLHLRYIYNPDNLGPAVFFLHGAVENGKIFYTHSNKGLAPFLAAMGYKCYVADLRGRGASLPAINARSQYGQTESILEDIPAFIAKISEHSGHFPQYWIAHSWGGILMNSAFARFPQWIDRVKACAYFGTKRSLYNRHPSKLFQANLLWYFLAPLISKKKGYLPAKNLGWGSDDESRKSHWQSMQWAKVSPWIDSDDQFNYANALALLSLPPTLHIAGVKDKALAQPIDIQKFIDESGRGKQVLNIYGKRFGHRHNYNHIDMLTHPMAHHDQFNDLVEWFKSHQN